MTGSVGPNSTYELIKWDKMQEFHNFKDYKCKT